VDVAVYEYLKSIIDGTNEAGIITANLANGGVGLAPFHDWESLIPDEVVGKIKEAIDGLISGSISTGYEP
jgi:basic membrane protein A